MRNQKGGQYKMYKVVATGHSLGAGTACLLSMLLASRADISVETFAFAPPPVISPSASTGQRPLQVAPQEPVTTGTSPRCVIHSFVNHHDVVARSSHNEFMKMLAAVGAIDRLPWSPEERVVTLFRGQLTDAEAEQMNTAIGGVKAAEANGKCHLYGTQLVIPGHLYLLSPEPKEGQNHASDGMQRHGQMFSLTKECDPLRVFNGFLFTGDSMVTDHTAGAYMKALIKVEKYFEK